MTGTKHGQRSPKSKTTDALLALLLGALGAHRYYEGKIATGVLWTLTLGLFSVGALADLLQILTGVRTDKAGRSIGRPRRSHRPLFTLGSVAGAVVITTVLVFASGSALITYSTSSPLVQDKYWEQTDAKSPIERQYTALGPSPVSTLDFDTGEERFASGRIWYPSSLSDTDTTYPVVVIANGTGVTYTRVEPIYDHLASWGFIVVGNDDSDSGDGRSSAVSLERVLALTANPDSVLYGRVDVNHIGISGHSQGGAGAINAATNFGVSEHFTSIYTASAASLELIRDIDAPWAYTISKLQIPYFSVAGTGDADSKLIAPLESLRENFDTFRAERLAVMARRVGANHGDTLPMADGYMTAWFRYTLMGDEEAATAFVGAKAEILTNPDWSNAAVKDNAERSTP